MKQFILGSIVVSLALILFFPSCKSKDPNDPMILPNIVFKQTAGYTYKDTTVAAGTSLLTGIKANKTEIPDILKVFSITRSLDGGAASSVYTYYLNTSEGDSFSYNYPIQTRNVAGTEKYTYTISNRDGLINNVSLTIHTQ